MKRVILAVIVLVIGVPAMCLLKFLEWLSDTNA